MASHGAAESNALSELHLNERESKGSRRSSIQAKAVSTERRSREGGR
jgi:hypothetical protein